MTFFDIPMATHRNSAAANGFSINAIANDILTF